MKKILVMLMLLTFSASIFAGFSSSGRSSSFGSRSYSSPSRSYSSPSRSYSSPSRSVFSGSPSAPSKPSGSLFKFGSSAKTSTASAPVSKPTNSKLFDSFKTKYAAQSAPPKQVMASDLNKIFDRKYRTERRGNFYSGYHAPAYTTRYVTQHSNYGMWDAMLMWSILDGMGDRQMYYHHQNDPAFQQWRTDANQLCQEGNKEVCNKLSALDAEVNKLKTSGVKQQAGYITDGVDPNIYIADGIKMDNLNEVKICTGTASSDYSRFASIIADKTKLKVKTVATNGSIDNLYKLSTGACDMAFTQSDALTSKELVSFLQLETKEDAMLICNKKSGVKELDDISDKHKIYVGSDQTGSLFTFNNLSTKEVSELAIAKLDTSKPTIMAADLVNSEENSCLFSVTTYRSQYIKLLNDKNNAVFVPIEAEQTGYQPVRMDWTDYKNLVQSNHNGWFDGGTMTPAVYPVLVTTATWIEQNPVIYYDVLVINKDYLNKELK